LLELLDALLVVLFQRGEEQLLLVAEGAVQAPAVQAHLGEQVVDAGAGVAALPERLHRLGGRRVGVEFFVSGHGASTPLNRGTLAILEQAVKFTIDDRPQNC
jgi:hypothetical protein